MTFINLIYTELKLGYLVYLWGLWQKMIMHEVTDNSL